jgi:hypothetical protein
VQTALSQRFERRIDLTEKRVFVITALTLIILSCGLRLWLSDRRGFNPDELQHLHGAWCISKGMVPYRDYFDHHMPWLHFSLALMLSRFDVETDFEDATRFIVLARQCMWLYTGAILALTFWLGWKWRGPRVAWLGVFLLSYTMMFFSKSVEIRPDVPAAMFLLASLAFALHVTRDECHRLLCSGLAGAFMGAAVLCTQKSLFALPGFVLATGLCLLKPRTSRL